MDTPNNHCEAADCTEVHALLCELFDPSTTPERVEEIRVRVKACPHCFGQLESEEAVRRIVRSCCGQAHAPEPLRKRIIASLSSVTYTEIRYR
ncbi:MULTISPECIES: mycothiol system anti-sigma-R factor [Corynebacterium]|uniref:Anti-sigma factor n=1 Tax=Corynebacterium imitans TaxID=156978 RepID=A0A076NEZ4_9CORY|nr:MULTISPECIES: mycothiol system anti-sigma-R factor [Corynebacterium]AIJ32994.1 hypothetical protein CIMIT_02905 [Corynebacterium imitans]MCG7278828.1 mycothiol system anti-sigma-R factor [Corynebacterium imitans]OFP34147.1 hypothetical protein HMPREF2990_10505 [Corynebacterium sp. HMSC071B10]OHF36458.1 mycothiol system anti-sigma-R factor [Corynebacterium sp. HMSC074A01]SNV60877.1 Anti-sigma factor [Corynebacterium imitans]